MQEIQMLRERLRLTKRQLAGVLGVSGRTVHRWERGEGSPHEIYLERMRALVDARDLGGGQDGEQTGRGNPEFEADRPDVPGGGLEHPPAGADRVGVTSAPGGDEGKGQAG